MIISAKKKSIPFTIELDSGEQVELCACEFTISDQIKLSELQKEFDNHIHKLQYYNAAMMSLGVRGANGKHYWQSVDEVIECDFPLEFMVQVVQLVADINNLNGGEKKS